MKAKLLTALLALIVLPTYSQLIISSNTTWTTNQVLTQSVLVQQGVTLTINPGVQVQVLFIDNNSDLIGDVKIEIKGTIKVLGDACNKVNFLPYVTTSNKKYWSGIEIDTLSINSSILNSSIQNANIGVKVENSSLNISGVEIINSKINGINVLGTNSTVMVNNSVIRGCDSEGVFVSNASSMNLTNSKIKQNGLTGITLLSAQNVTIENSVVYNNGQSGVYLKSSTANISNSIFRKNSRMGLILSNSNVVCNLSDIDSNLVDGCFIGGNSSLTMTNSTVSENQGFGIETSEYIFNTDFGNIQLDGNAPLMNVSNSNFINNQNSQTIISSLQITNMQPASSYMIGNSWNGPNCGVNSNGCNVGSLISWDESCNGQSLNPSPVGAWYTYTTFHIPFGFFAGFNGTVGINPTSSAWNYRPNYGVSNIATPQSPFWQWSYNATNINNPLSSFSSGCYPMNAGMFTLSDKIGFMAANGGNLSASGASANTDGYTKYSISEFYFQFGGYNYRSLINNSGVTDILINNFWDTIVPTAVVNSVGAVLNINGFVISEILASHSSLSNNFIYSNSSTFQLQQSSPQFCVGSNNYLIAPLGSYNYQWYNNGNLLSNNNDSLQVTSNGNYLLVLSGACNLSSSTINVTIQSGTPVTITPNGPLTFCAGNNVTLTSPVSTGNVWSNGSTSQSINVSTNGGYYVTVTNANGCPSISPTVQVSVTALPASPVITASQSTTFCAGNSIFLTSNIPSNIIWSNGLTSQSITVSNSGSYSAQVISNGCTSAPSNIIQVSVQQNPNSTITASGPVNFCQGNSVVLNVPAVVGNSYQWYNNGVAINGATLNFYTASSSGNYSVSVTNGSCFSNSSPTVVSVNTIPSAPVISANGNIVFCQGGSVILNSNSPNVIWSNGLGSQAITVNQGGTYSAQTLANGCLSANSNPINVTVNALPIVPLVSASGPLTFCAGGSVTLTSSSISGNVWSNNLSGQSISVSNSGSYYVTNTDINGCSSSSIPTLITVNPIPSAPIISANGPITFCSGENVTLSSNSLAGNLWSNNVTLQSNVISTSGTYSAVVTENGCTSAPSNTIIVTVNAIPPQPIISASGSTTFCSGNFVVLTSSASNGNTWNNNEISQSINVTNSGIYTVQVNNNGCTSSSNPVVITVNATPTAPVINANGPTSFCQGSNVTLTTNASSGVTWTISNGSQFSVPTLIVQSSQSSITATVTQNGCTSTPSIPISTSVLPIGTPVFTQIQPKCVGQTFNLPSTSNNGYSGTWTPAINNNATTTYTFTPNAGQCANNQTMTVNINPLPQVSLNSFNSVCDTLGMVNLFGGSPSGGNYSGSSVSNNTFNTSIGIGTYPIVYSYTNSNGCSNSATQNLTVISCSSSGFDEQSGITMSIFPNPTFDWISISFSENVEEAYFICDSQGRRIISGQVLGMNESIDLSTLTSGNYFLHMGNRVVVKLIKQ